jgi:hypothetical protein
MLQRARQEENKDILSCRCCGCGSESMSESVSSYGTGSNQSQCPPTEQDLTRVSVLIRNRI